jgi:hypothetical protein
MPLIEVPVTLAGNPTESDVKHTQGLLEQVIIRYEASAPAVIVALELKIRDTGVDATDFVEIWRSPSTNTNDYYLPTKGTTLADGTEGGVEGHIPMKSNLGWRVNVIGGASTGIVRVFVGLDQ